MRVGSTPPLFVADQLTCPSPLSSGHRPLARQPPAALNPELQCLPLAGCWRYAAFVSYPNQQFSTSTAPSSAGPTSATPRSEEIKKNEETEAAQRTPSLAAEIFPPSRRLPLIRPPTTQWALLRPLCPRYSQSPRVDSLVHPKDSHTVLMLSPSFLLLSISLLMCFESEAAKYISCSFTSKTIWHRNKFVFFRRNQQQTTPN